MPLNVKDFATLVADQQNAINVALNQNNPNPSNPIIGNFSAGTVLGAIVNANAGLGTWLQALILQVALRTRAATSCGEALDTWMAQFLFYRLQATYANGQVTFTASTPPSSPIPIPVNTYLLAGTLQFITTVAALLPAGATSVSVPVQCVTAGTVGNVAAGAINALQSPIPGISSVSNAVGFTNGIAAELDPAFRTRFWNYLQSLAKATKGALQTAILGVQQGLTLALYENNPSPGMFVAVVDDGTGNPPATLLSTISSAIELVRGLTIQYSVQGPTTVPINFSMHLVLASGYTTSYVQGLVQQALTTYTNGLGINGNVQYATVIQTILASCPGIINVQNVLINSGTSDIAISQTEAATVGTFTWA